MIAVANLVAPRRGLGRRAAAGPRPAACSSSPALMLAAAVGMWQRRYWAVLGFEALLGIGVTYAGLSLLVATNVAAVVLCLAVILGGGFLFWKLVRVMARIQVASRRPTSPSARLAPPHARERLRLHRHRFRAGWVRGRDPRRAARHEDRHRREGPDRRALPELRVHPGQGRAAGGRHRLGDRRGVGVRHHRPGALDRLRRRRRAAAEGHQDADRRRRRR